MNYTVRKAIREDLPRIEEIYAYARKFMADNGNPNQWGTTTPPTYQLEDDIEKGLVGALISEPIDPTPVSQDTIIFINGNTFIKPKMEYIYTLGREYSLPWKVEKGIPVKLEPFVDENNFTCVKVKWLSTYSGQFDLMIGDYQKTIVVESLF